MLFIDWILPIFGPRRDFTVLVSILPTVRQSYASDISLISLRHVSDHLSLLISNFCVDLRACAWFVAVEFFRENQCKWLPFSTPDFSGEFCERSGQSLAKLVVGSTGKSANSQVTP
jgi:hypothetical protein